MFNKTNKCGLLVAPCAEDEFHCDGMCLNQALVCNGQKNCPVSGKDEQGCDTGGRYRLNDKRSGEGVGKGFFQRFKAWMGKWEGAFQY